ncbi:MAG: hypothetical protein ACYDC6_03735 [Acidobacteriaceae bacterium]
MMLKRVAHSLSTSASNPAGNSVREEEALPFDLALCQGVNGMAVRWGGELAVAVGV